jgi:hypothetical protein
MGYDLPTGKRGNVPTSKTYKKDLSLMDGEVQQLYQML